MDPLPLLPEAPSPRRCRCGRPVPKGRLIQGWGSGCAVEHGVAPAPTPRVTTVRQEGESLFDLLTWDTAGVGADGRVAESPELRGRGETVEDMIEWLNGVLDQDEAETRDLLYWTQQTILTLQDPKLLGRRIPGWHDWPRVEKLCQRHLTDVAADRAILAWYETTAGQLERARQLRLPHDLTQAAAVAYLDVVKLIATKYATWPGYQQSWAPEGSRG